MNTFDLALETFKSKYWRKQPLLLKGGAREFLDGELSITEFNKIADQLRENKDPALMEEPGTVTFVEEISLYIPRLQERADQLSHTFGATRAWFDATCTEKDDGGLGEHFDHSDNFIIMIEGQELWRVSKPDRLDRKLVAMRMFGVEGVGGASIAEDKMEEFEVEARDVLYLPLFWVHSGLSRGKTLSLSFTVPAISLQAVFAPALATTMRDLMIGYHPVPLTGAAEDRATRDKMLTAACEIVLKRSQQSDFQERLSENMRRILDGPFR